MSKADEIYNSLVRKINTEGISDFNLAVRPKYADGSPAHTKGIFGVQVEFEEGVVPLLTSKHVAVKTAIKEMMLFWVKQTVKEKDFKDSNVKVWDEWFEKDGTLGRSYAYQFESHRHHERSIVKVKPIRKKKHGSLEDVVVGEKVEVNKECNDPIVGQEYTNSQGRKFTVIDVYKGDKSKHNLLMAKVQFHSTNNIVEAYKSHVIKGKVMDNFARTYCGVGYMGNYTSVKNYSKDEIVYLKKLWRGIITRCYYPKQGSYVNYGNKGVFVDERWHSFENFLRDVRYLPNFFIARDKGFKGFELDKDYYSSNCYSKDTCVWLTKKENQEYKNCKPFKLYKDGEYVGTYLSVKQVGEQFGFHSSNLTRVLNGEKKDVKGFTAEYIVDDDYVYRYELSRNQVVELLNNIKNNPSSRRLMTSFWNYADVDKKALQECAWSTQWNVRGDKLDLILIQRSGDIGLGVPFNWFQYWVLQKMVAHVTGLKQGRFIHQLGNVHYYDRHEQTLLNQINLPSFSPPEITINEKVKDFFDFTPEDITIEGYKHGPTLNMEVAI